MNDIDEFPDFITWDYKTKTIMIEAIHEAHIGYYEIYLRTVNSLLDVLSSHKFIVNILPPPIPINFNFKEPTFVKSLDDLLIYTDFVQYFKIPQKYDAEHTQVKLKTELGNCSVFTTPSAGNLIFKPKVEHVGLY